MEQLITTFGINWKLLLIQAINFGVLLGALTYFLYTPLMKVIDDRREKIAEGVRTAEAAARRLDEAKAEGDSLVGEAAKRAEGLVASARMQADEKASAIAKDAQTRADNLMVETKARAEEEKRQMMLSSEREIARAAMLVAEKILREKTT